MRPWFESATSLPFYKRKLADFYLKVTLLDRRATPTICPRKGKSSLRVLRNAARGGAVLYLPRRAHHSSPARRRRSAPESTHQEWGESPHRTEELVCS